MARAAHYAPMEGREKVALFVYQATTLVLVILPCMLFVKIDSALAWGGVVAYGMGLLCLAISMACFVRPSDGGVCTKGIYRYARNPMYVAYFLIFLGCTAMTTSIWMLLTLVAFQLSAHFVILAEERWCLDAFGDAYKAYMQRVRRYL